MIESTPGAKSHAWAGIDHSIKLALERMVPVSGLQFGLIRASVECVEGSMPGRWTIPAACRFFPRCLQHRQDRERAALVR